MPCISELKPMAVTLCLHKGDMNQCCAMWPFGVRLLFLKMRKSKLVITSFNIGECTTKMTTTSGPLNLQPVRGVSVRYPANMQSKARDAVRKLDGISESR